MSKKTVWGIVVVAVGLAAVYGTYSFQTNRISPERLREMRMAEQRVAEAESEEIVLAKAEPGEAKDEAREEAREEAKAPAGPAPDEFKVLFRTTAGDFTVLVHKEWAPLGAQRFYDLVRAGFYDDSGFFRVVPGFVVQFGLAADPAVTLEWRDKRLPAEAPKTSNKRGTLAFAMGRSPDTRTTQVFINLADNSRLDGMGFAPFAEVVSGMDVVERITAQYGEAPRQDLIQQLGNDYLEKQFPNLDFIDKATLILDEKAPEK